MVKVSISVVLYNNSEEQINKLINNLKEVTSDFTNVDIYLVDNSPDNQELKLFLNKINMSKSIHIFFSKNKGFGAGHNKVLNSLNSDYHFVVNPDVFVENSAQINKMIEFMEDHKEYGLLSPLIKFPDGRLQKLVKHQPTILDMGLRFINVPGFDKRREWFVNFPDGYREIHDAENISGSFMLFRTEILKQIKGFDENYFLYMEDADITRKVNVVSRTVFYPNAFVYHDWQRNNKRSFSGILHMISSMVKYFNKWGWKFY
jgi:GT2 family glycosyltransferase